MSDDAIEIRCHGCGVYAFMLPRRLPPHWVVQLIPDNLDRFYCGNCAKAL
jgi:hypothetical protein